MVAIAMAMSLPRPRAHGQVSQLFPDFQQPLSMREEDREAETEILGR